MNLFYEDLKVYELERKLDYCNIIHLLEERFSIVEDVETINSLIAYSWFFFIEGDINQKPLNFDPNFFFAKWKYYVDKGLEKFADEPLFCLIAGYTLMLHGFYISSKYEDMGLELLSKCKKISNNKEITNLASFWLNDSKRTRRIDVNSIAYHLFCGDSLLDHYFFDLLSIK